MIIFILFVQSPTQTTRINRLQSRSASLRNQRENKNALLSTPALDRYAEAPQVWYQHRSRCGKATVSIGLICSGAIGPLISSSTTRRVKVLVNEEEAIYEVRVLQGMWLLNSVMRWNDDRRAIRLVWIRKEGLGNEKTSLNFTAGI